MYNYDCFICVHFKAIINYSSFPECPFIQHQNRTVYTYMIHMRRLSWFMFIPESLVTHPSDVSSTPGRSSSNSAGPSGPSRRCARQWWRHSPGSCCWTHRRSWWWRSQTSPPPRASVGWSGESHTLLSHSPSLVWAHLPLPTGTAS